MEAERRNQIILGVLGVALVVVAVRAWNSQSAPPLTSSKGAAGQAPAVRRPKSVSVGALDVHLKALGAEHSKPADASRNLFRFKSKPPPPPPSALRPAAPQSPGTPPLPTGTPAPPPLPPIALKFIGLVQTADKSQRLAVLSDGRGSVPMYGKEGDIIDGRYRIVRIGVESIELIYLDGRGRQTLRLSGG
ncbi:MAG: hypothetical protein ABJA98_07830 [Acidobacteriota bacterium]